MNHLEVLALVPLGTLVFHYQINGTIKRCWKALHRPGSATLLLHILLSVFEVMRYYSRRYHNEYYLPYSNNANNTTVFQQVYNTSAESTSIYSGHDEFIGFGTTKEGPKLPTATLLDLVLMLVQCHTSLLLARDRVWAGHKSILRPVYHSQTLFRILPTVGSFFLSSDLSPRLPLETIPGFESWVSPEQLYRASIMVNVSFVYPRLLVWTLCRLGGVGPLGRRYRDVYTFSIFLSAVVAMHDGGITLGPQLYIAGVVMFVVLERWVAREMLERAASTVEEEQKAEAVTGESRKVVAKRGLGVKDRLVDFLAWYGFVEVDMLRSEKKEQT
ncbi:hypothetical protein PG996_008000 [Apiospora saccharicola]|uniref:Wax synthase domain-containing protein n=1 Tax=Apiospora saccharicola TaxID=335842 RepID=A0ABR1UZX1_9PEZI